MLLERFHRYGFELAPEKTRIIRFGRFAAHDTLTDNQKGFTKRTKPETFCFLGFEFYCSKSKKSGKFCPKVKSDGKRVKTKLAKLKSWMIEHRHDKLDAIFKHFNDVLRGYYHYYAVTCNLQMVRLFRYRVIDVIFKWLNRRSQKKSYTMEQFKQMMTVYPLLEPTIRMNIYTYCDE